MNCSRRQPDAGPGQRHSENNTSEVSQDLDGDGAWGMPQAGMGSGRWPSDQRRRSSL